MNPQTLAVLGAGAFMFLLFVIVGIIVWMNSEDDEDDEDDDDKKANDGENEEEGDLVCGEECQASFAMAARAGVLPGTTTTDGIVMVELPASDGNKGRQSRDQANAAATAVGMTLESTAQSMWCSPGYVAMDGVCYPICDNYVYEDGAPGTQVEDIRKYYQAKGSSGATSGCGTTDSGSNKAHGDADGKIQEMQTSQNGFCNNVFAKDSVSLTGYTICHASGGRCRASFGTEYPKIECIPKNAIPSDDTSDSNRKAPECSNKWNYGTNPSRTVGVLNWGDEGGDGCKCYDDTTEVTVHNGDGNWWAENTWRCNSNRADE